MSFIKKKINVKITLAQGKFGTTGTDTITFENHRISAIINAYAGDAQGQLQCQIWGLPLEVMNELTTMGPIATQNRNNRISITAGEEGGAMATGYSGTISNYAYADLNSAPEVPFNILALSAAYEAVKAGKNRSYPNAVAAADVMADIATEMGRTFENNGVSTMLPKGAVYYGSLLSQVKEVARDAGIYWTDDRGILAIWPKKQGYRKGDPIEISPGNGMVGYPCLASNGLMVRCIFNPGINLGGRVKISGSSLTVANGTWAVFRVTHTIDAEMVGGAWFTDLLCYRPDWVQ